MQTPLLWPVGKESNLSTSQCHRKFTPFVKVHEVITGSTTKSSDDSSDPLYSLEFNYKEESEKKPISQSHQEMLASSHSRRINPLKIQKAKNLKNMESYHTDNDNKSSDEDDERNKNGSSTKIADDERKYELDDFKIVKTVGTGTFGRVCLCYDRSSKKYCAMKILAMSDIIRLKQIEHVKNERDILREIKHPFVISLVWSTRDDVCLYMIFEYVCGGELFSYLRNEGRFSSSKANFYAAEITSALEYLHAMQIVYRDLKPENLLLNRDGHLKITDFGFAKKLRDRTWTLCGTPEYLAPEIIQSKGHNKAVDWWALGVLIYEMLVGYPPFYDENPFGIYEKILNGKIDWPRHMDPIAKDLVKKLLTNDRTKRLGNMKNGADDVKRHRWFKHLDWAEVYNKKLEPPIVPDVKFDGDTSNFDDYPESDWKPTATINQRDLLLFIDF